MTRQAAYEGLRDRAVRHRIALEYYAAGEVRAILRFIRQVERDALAKIAALQIDPNLTRSQRAQLSSLEGLLRELRVTYAEGYTLLERRALLGLENLAAFEAEFHTATLRAALDDLAARAGGAAGALQAASGVAILSPTATQLRAVLASRPMAGKVLSAIFSDMREAHVERIETALRIGYTEGEGIPDLMRRVREASNVNARGAETIARTAVTHISTEVAQETYARNADLVNEVEWVSVLDARTTSFCRATDGKRFPLDEGPRPPAHPRCRSTTSPVLADFPPPKRETYNGWLRRQSAEVQDEILGVTRGRLFRSGGLTVEQFVAKDGSTLTIAQLRAMFPEVFKRAGV